MSFEEHYARFAGELPDFWNRRQNAPVYAKVFTVFGRNFQLITNEEEVLQAVHYSQSLYSSAPTIDSKGFEIQINVESYPISPGPLPDNLFDHIQYSGHDNWLAMQLGGWGHCQINLATGRALAVLSTELGCRPEAISRYILNTILTNFIIASGLGLLHTTAIYRNGQILMMMAGHNSGKSTTALHLTLAGYAFVSDSQIYIEHGVEGLSLYGFPVGRVKLRQDMLANFPLLEAHLRSEPVRQETKFRLDLHLVEAALVYDDVIRPDKIHLCLLKRNGRKKSDLTRADSDEIMAAALGNSLYYDRPEVWQKNLEQIERLVQQAEKYHLAVGSDVDDIIRVVDGIMG